jgi:hypothetical protein
MSRSSQRIIEKRKKAPEGAKCLHRLGLGVVKDEGKN